MGKGEKIGIGEKKISASEASREVVSLCSIRSPILDLFDRAAFLPFPPLRNLVPG